MSRCVPFSTRAPDDCLSRSLIRVNEERASFLQSCSLLVPVMRGADEYSCSGLGIQAEDDHLPLRHNFFLLSFLSPFKQRTGSSKVPLICCSSCRSLSPSRLSIESGDFLTHAFFLSSPSFCRTSGITLFPPLYLFSSSFDAVFSFRLFSSSLVMKYALGVLLDSSPASLVPISPDIHTQTFTPSSHMCDSLLSLILELER